MNEYMLGFIHACKLIKKELEDNKIENIKKIISIAEKEEIKEILTSMGLQSL